jgi:hypothetical protein
MIHEKVFFLLTLVTEEATRDVELFAADNDNLLSIESLLSNDRSKTTKKVTLAVDDNDLNQPSQRDRKIAIQYVVENGEQKKGHGVKVDLIWKGKGG